MKETESRATDVLPLWKVPALAPLIPRQRKALQAVSLIRQTTEELIAKCKQMVDAEEQVTVLLLLVCSGLAVTVAADAVAVAAAIASAVVAAAAVAVAAAAAVTFAVAAAADSVACLAAAEGNV